MFGALNEFISGAIWLALIIALGFTGWRAVKSGSFRAVSASYYGRKAQNLGAICLAVSVIASLLFLQRLLTFRFQLDVFFLLGAAFGGYLTYRYYERAI